MLSFTVLSDLYCVVKIKIDCVIFKWHTYDIRQAHKMAFYELGARHMYAI